MVHSSAWALLSANAFASIYDESSMLQMPAMETNLAMQTEEDTSDCRCPGYFREQCEAEAAQGCVWTDAGSSNRPWCQCRSRLEPGWVPEPQPRPPVVPAPPVVVVPVPAAPAPAPAPAPDDSWAPAPAPSGCANYGACTADECANYGGMALPTSCCWEDYNCDSGQVCNRNDDPEVAGVCSIDDIPAIWEDPGDQAPAPAPAPVEETPALPASGFYRMQQKETMLYADAHTGGNDHNAVTRTSQDNPSQWWYLESVGALEDQVFTIQQVENWRYLDAHESASHDFRVVTRSDQDNDSQRWHFTGVATGTFTINQAVNMKFLDAHVGGNDGQLVTRDEQGDDSQQWVLTPLSSEEEQQARDSMATN